MGFYRLIPTFLNIPSHSHLSDINVPFAPPLPGLGLILLGKQEERNTFILDKTVLNGRNYQHLPSLLSPFSEGFRRHSPKDGREVCAELTTNLRKNGDLSAPHYSLFLPKTGDHSAPHYHYFLRRTGGTLRLVMPINRE